VRVGGSVVGEVTSGGYGYTVGRSIAYAYLPVVAGGPVGGAGGLEVAVDGEWLPAELAPAVLYDPTGARIRL
jgi:4-methylaminobutanoate oxidase (formaldehyde-forming)